MAELLPQIKPQYFDSNGNPLAGGKLYSYEPGTVTPKATYTDYTGETPNTNPLILDANGQCDVWVKGGSYKFVLTDANDVVQWTKDNVPSTADIILLEGALAAANNLSDLTDPTAALANLGIGSLPDDLVQLQEAIGEHIGATEDAHDASAISTSDGSNLQAKINAHGSHILSTSNPHNVTAEQVGNTTAQWNASELQGWGIVDETPTLDYALTWTALGWAPRKVAASGGTGFNLFTNGNAEGDDLPWTVVQNTVAGAVPTPNATTTANAAVTIARSDSSPLNGDYSWLFTKDASNRQGHTLRAEVTVPSGYRNLELFWHWIYSLTSIPTDTILPFVSTWNGSTWDTPVALNSNRLGFKVGNPSGATKFLIQLHVATTSSVAGTLKFDDVVLDKTSILDMPIDRQVEINCAGSGNFTGGTLLVTRSGRTVTVSATSVLTFSSTIIAASAVGLIPDWARPSLSAYNVAEAGSSTLQRVGILSDGAIQIVSRDYAGTGVASTSSSAFTVTYSVSDTSSAVMSTTALMNETGRALLTSDASPAIGTSLAKLTFEDVTTDTSGSYSSGTFTAKSKGLKYILGHLLTDIETWSANQTVSLRAMVNGVQKTRVGEWRAQTSTTSNASMMIIGAVEMEVGDTLEIHAVSSVATNMLGTAGVNYLTIADSPNLTVYGTYGEYDYGSTEITSSSTTTTANTWLDVTGSGITVPAGTFTIGYDVTLIARNSAASAAAAYANVAFTDASNNVIAKSVGFVGDSNRPAASTMFGSVSRQVEVTNTVPTYYKLRIRSNGGTGTQVAEIPSNSFTATLTDSDSNSVVWYRKTR